MRNDLNHKRIPAKRLSAIDLFSGCGGLTEGLRRAGFLVAGAIEIDPLAAETYRLNHPNVQLIEKDIRDVSALSFRRFLGLERGELDLLAACPPCQGFSAMTTKNGGRRLRDARNRLVSEVLRFAKTFLPATILVENVPGLHGTRRFTDLRSELQLLGYETEHRLLDASAYGVPQRRRRLVLLAGRAVKPTFAKPARYKLCVRDVLAGLPRPGRSGDSLHDFPSNFSAAVAKRISRIPKNGGSRSALGKRWQLNCHKTLAGFHDVYGRMKWKDLAPTITSGCVNPSKGRFLHPSQNRAITLREAALLQTFPANYRFSLRKGKYAVAEMIGNALPPEFVRRQAAQIRTQLLREQRR